MLFHWIFMKIKIKQSKLRHDLPFKIGESRGNYVEGFGSIWPQLSMCCFWLIFLDSNGPLRTHITKHWTKLLIIIDIPCNFGKQHQLCASTSHSQAPNRKDEVKAATGYNGHVKAQKTFYEWKKKAKFEEHYAKMPSHASREWQWRGETKRRGNK